MSQKFCDKTVIILFFYPQILICKKFGVSRKIEFFVHIIVHQVWSLFIIALNTYRNAIIQKCLFLFFDISIPSTVLSYKHWCFLSPSLIWYFEPCAYIHCHYFLNIFVYFDFRSIHLSSLCNNNPLITNNMFSVYSVGLTFLQVQFSRSFLKLKCRNIFQFLNKCCSLCLLIECLDIGQLV